MAPLWLSSSALLGAILLAVGARAHGIASAIVVFPTGTFYRGYNPSYQYETPAPTVVGWSTPDDLQNGFIPPSKYADPDIVCHLGATPAGAEAPVNAGDTIEVQWTPWPISHKGPVLDYLAKCDGSCTKADKTKLEFFKIDEVGLVNAASDTWAATELTNNNNSWLVRIPKAIAPGNYVLRHEIIALHAAGNPDGAQSYPFCFNLAISGNGTDNPKGVLATELYKATDPGIHFNLFGKRQGYQIPGPSLYSNALTVEQTKAGAIVATATGIPSLVVAPKPTAASSASSASSASTEASKTDATTSAATAASSTGVTSASGATSATGATSTTTTSTSSAHEHPHARRW